MGKPNEATHPELAQQELSEAVYRPPITEVVKSGKVRNIHAFRGLVFETTNRISVFDRVIMENVPLKGAMLNCISEHNKALLTELGFTTDLIPVPRAFFEAAGFKAEDVGRLSYGEALTMLPVEFIVRGYLVGSAYKAYKKGEAYCGFTFPEGLSEGDKLPEPIVTPTTKAENGHDLPLTKEECIEHIACWLMDEGAMADADDLCEVYEDDFDAFNAELGDELSEEAWEFAGGSAEDSEDDWERAEFALAYEAAKEYVEIAYNDSLQAFDVLSEMCEEVGILFIDTKFEFGINSEDDVVLADEVGTPDSSRFASAAEYAESGKIVSMDKQIVRDYCSSVGFTGDESEPIPELPEELVEQVTNTYVHIAELICGEEYVAQYK